MTKRMALKKSIKYHEDNLKKLRTLKGEWGYRKGDNYFTMGNKKISFAGDKCALCILYSRFCDSCPLQRCGKGGSGWYKIYEAKTWRQAIKAEVNMVKVLKKILRRTK